MPWKRRRQDQDFSNEIDSHLELERDQLIREGLSPEQAEAAARKKFGNPTAVREDFYESGRMLWIDHLLQDLRFARRSLARYPLPCLVAILSLAGGIGAAAATLALRDTIFLRPPLLYQQPGQLSQVTISTPERPRGGLIPVALYRIWAAGRPSSEMAVSTPVRRTEVRFDQGLESLPVRAVSPELFPLLGVRPQLGESFPVQAAAASPAAALLSHRLWERLFDRSPAALGSVIWIGERAYTIAGVMPERFWFSEMDSPIWTALDTSRLADGDQLEVIIRRPAGVDPEALGADLEQGVAVYSAGRPAGERRVRVVVSAVRGTPLGNQVGMVVVVLVGLAVLGTLLIACMNVVVLMTAQWTGREREIAIRATLGAGRGRIVRMLLTESVLLAVLGGLLGVVVLLALRSLLLSRVPAALFFDFSISPATWFQTGGLMFLVGVLSGLAPALLETGRLQANPLHAFRRERQRLRRRHGLVVAEIAVTVALLVVTGVMVDAHRRNLTADLGFRPDPLIMLRLENAAGIRVEEVLQALASLPGVEGAAGSTSPPLSGLPSSRAVAEDPVRGLAAPVSSVLVSPDFFSTLRVPLLGGRFFETGDGPTAFPAVIVNQKLAEQLWGGQDPVGKQVRLWGFGVHGGWSRGRLLAVPPAAPLSHSLPAAGSGRPATAPGIPGPI